MTRRSRGREVALQVLYQLEQNSGVVNPEVRRFIERRVLGDRELVIYTIGLVEGVKKHQPQIDEAIKQVAENWRLDRMAAIDRNILRLGAFEILHRDDVPAKVAINEALELAKRYSTAQSSRFVNGILDKVLQTSKPGRANEGGEADPESTAAPAAEPPAAEGPAE
ncbi:MAG: transcription antitermination factor NusB [Planctomycetales bacterium 71-10]|nr:MAG: transcription antitermination factor NusB [Planctomycetales bacterium 71-10]